jgi:hypothetical protein
MEKLQAVFEEIGNVALVIAQAFAAVVDAMCGG